MKKAFTVLLFTLCILLLISCSGREQSQTDAETTSAEITSAEVTTTEQTTGPRITLEAPGKGALTMEGPTSATVYWIGKGSEYIYTRKYDSVMSRDRLEKPLTGSYYDAVIEMNSGVGLPMIIHIYDPYDTAKIDEILDSMEFEEVESIANKPRTFSLERYFDSEEYARYVFTIAGDMFTTAEDTDPSENYVYRAFEDGRVERSKNIASYEQLSDIMLCIFLSENRPLSSGGFWRFGIGLAGLEITLEYKGYAIALDDSESRAFIDLFSKPKTELDGSGNSRLIGSFTFNKDECIRFTAKETTIYGDSSEEVYYFDKDGRIYNENQYKITMINFESTLWCGISSDGGVIQVRKFREGTFDALIKYVEKKLNK